MLDTQQEQTPKLTFRDLIMGRIGPNSESVFRNWIARQGWNVRDQSIARTALSTWIEQRTESTCGVYFIDSESFEVGRGGESLRYRNATDTAYPGKGTVFDTPDWMLAYIKSFPRASWGTKR